MNRGRGLRRNPEQARDWQDRSRTAALERDQARRPPDETGRRKRRKVTVPTGVRSRVMSRSGGVCVACLHREGIDPDRLSIAALRQLVRRGTLSAAVQLHHVLAERNWPELAEDEDNLVGVCVGCHAAHEEPGAGDGAFAWEVLPPVVRAYVRRRMAEDGRIDAFVRRKYRGVP